VRAERLQLAVGAAGLGVAALGVTAASRVATETLAPPAPPLVAAAGRRVFALQLALGAAGLAACALAIAAGVSAVHVAPAAAHRLDVGGLRLTYPAVNAAAALLLAQAALGAAVLIVAARMGWRQLHGHRRLVRALPVRGPLPGHAGVSLVEADAPLAFCAGWLRPRIYVSTGAVERLSRDELRVVLAHEHHHRALRDPLRLAVGRVLGQALFFLPALRPLGLRYGDVAELRADRAAVAAGGVAPLASAMLSFAGGVAPERVDALLGRAPAWRLPWLPLGLGLAALAVPAGLAWRAASGASVQATLNLPLVSSQPCVLVLALVPVLACLAGLIGRRS
jgi:Peptidase family M48